MEVFTLAVVSLAIAAFLFFTKRQNRIHLSLACLCLAIFFYKGAGFFSVHFHSGFWSVMEMFGLLAISPLIISFGRLLLSDQSLLSLRQTMTAAFISLILLVSLFAPLADWPYWSMLIYIYPASVLAFCYGALILFIRSKPAGMERTRMLYLSIAFGVAALISALDVIKLFGYDFSPLYMIFLPSIISLSPFSCI